MMKAAVFRIVLAVLTCFSRFGATPELVIEESALRAIDTVELFRNGLYWWTSSSCSGELVVPGGAAYIAYTDPRLLVASAPSYAPRAGSSGGFVPGDTFGAGPSLGVASIKTSALRGVLLPDCGYGAHFVRDDEAFYYAKNRELYRKPLTASAFASGEPISYLAGLDRFAIRADGVLFVTDTEVWSYAADLARNTLTINRTWKTGARDVTRIREVLTMPGVSLRKFAIADIQATDGSYLGSELILLSPNGNLYRAGVVGGSAQLAQTGVNDFALRNETYMALGNLGVTVRRRTTTLYMAANSQLLGLDLNAGARGSFVEYNAPPNFRATSVAVDKNHIFVTRTPASGLGNSDLVRRAAPAEPSLLNPGDPDYAVIAQSREFRSLRSSGRLVYFAHGNTVQRVSVTAPAINIDFEAFGVEVTQAIQNMNNTVPLVAGRRALVRGYARLAANSTGLAGFDVPAQLRVFHAPKVEIGQAPFTEISGSPLLPIHAPQVTAVASLQTVRTNLAATYQFDVPESMVREGNLRFEFALNPNYVVPETGINPLANNTAAATISAKESIVLPLTMVPVQFNGRFYDPNAPDSAFWEIIARARTLLPFAHFRIGIRNPGVSKSVLGAPPRSFDLPKEERAALNTVDFARILDGNPLGGPYVGMFPPTASPWNGLGRRPGQVQIIRMATHPYQNSKNPWSTWQGGFNLAHEFGHNSGLKHFRNAATCGSIPLGSDKTYNMTPGNYDGYPGGFDACTLGLTDLDDVATSVGFDPISWSIVPPAINGELMSYANSVWISEYNWMRLYESFTFRFPNSLSALALRATAAPGPFLLAVGSVNLRANTAALQPAYTLPAGTLMAATLDELTAVPQDLPANHPVRLQLLGDGGAVLADHLVPLHFDEDGSAEEVSISRAIPLLDGARAIRLINGANVLAELPISARAPALQLDPPALANGQINLAWTGTDADGDRLAFTTQLSADNGQTWRTLTLNQAEPNLSINASKLPGGAAARVRVLATDGVRTAIATSDAFALPKHAPEVRITGVTDLQQIDFGSTVSVEGFGYDAEDGSLSNSALTWTLTGPDPRQGAGGSFSIANLAPGAYSLMLTGIDSDGEFGSHTVRFVIGGFTVADGAEPVLDGLSADAAYAKTPPIRFATANGLYANARFAHANGALFVCFTGLRYGAANTSGAVAGLRVDSGNSGQVVAATAGFAVNEHGQPLRVAGDGSKFVALESPPPGFSVVILRDENAWSAEMRIEDGLLAGWNNQLGLVVLFDDGNVATPPETWPPNANIDQPGSWAVSRPAPLVPQELIVNGSFENTAGTFARDGNGMMSLPAGSQSIPGWTTPGAELVWAENSNVFGATTPEGSYFLDLTGYHDSPPYGAVSQTIATVPGRSYRLSLAVGSHVNYSATKSVSVCAGSSAALFTWTPTNTVGSDWRSFSFNFTATAPSTEVTIQGVLGGFYIGLDNVSVMADNSPPQTTPRNLVVNGSFEFESAACPLSFVPDHNSVMSLPPGSAAIAGWTTTTAEIIWGVNRYAFGLWTPHDSMFLDLTGYHDTPPYGGIRQMLATTAGENYRLTFSLGADQDRTLFRGPMSVEATVGSTSRTFTFTPTGTGIQWGTFTMDFTAESGSTPLEFKGIASGGGQYLGLDNVSVVARSDGEEVRITAAERIGSELRVSFTAVPGRTYIIQRRAALDRGTWESIPGAERVAASSVVQIDLLIDPSQPQQFFRVQAGP